MKLIRVWDLPTRVGHWLLAVAFLVAWITGDSEEWRLVHVMAGATMVAVVLYRVAWGFVGTNYARFNQFVMHPAAVVAYLKSLLGGSPEHHTGHNPAGGLAIVALLATTLVTGAVGWLAYQDFGGDWLGEFHEGAANFLMALVGVHLAGVAIGSLAHGENLPRSMVTGLKRGEASEAITGTKPVALVVLLIWVVAAAWLLSR
jgi:cytochrome b